MATSIVGTFEVWLTEKLTSVSSDIDTDVFVSYIIGILDTDDDNEDKTESVSGLLEGVMEPSTATEVSKAIVDEWTTVNENMKGNEVTDDIGEKLSEIMEKHTVATVKEKQLTADEKSRKAAILKQYAVVSDGEETDDDDDEFGDGIAERADKQDSNDGLMVKNINKQLVDKSAKEMREKSKQESEKKKEKDKQDRLAQKQKAEDRKKDEKKRTQKGERRR